jgi:hypothetical protein
MILLATNPDRNEVGQRPTGADRGQSEPQASAAADDSNVLCKQRINQPSNGCPSSSTAPTSIIGSSPVRYLSELNSMR